MTSRSVWQRPAALTRTSTSCGCSASISSVSIDRGSPMRFSTAARNFILSGRPVVVKRLGIVVALDVGSAVEDLRIALGDLAMELEERRVHVPRGLRLVL